MYQQSMLLEKKNLKQKVGTDNAGKMSGSQRLREALSLRGDDSSKYVKRKQSQSYCNGSRQPSLIVFYPAVENYSRDMSKSIYSIPSCLPNITTNTNKFIVHWIPLCNWIERVVDLFYLKRKRKFYEWVKFCQRSSPSPNYLLKESSLGFLSVSEG